VTYWQIKEGAIIGTGQGSLHEGHELVVRPFSTFDLGEDGGSDEDFTAGICATFLFGLDAAFTGFDLLFLAFSCLSFASSLAMRSSMVVMVTPLQSSWRYFSAFLGLNELLEEALTVWQHRPAAKSKGALMQTLRVCVLSRLRPDTP
jgi:hypothetical protein